MSEPRPRPLKPPRKDGVLTVMIPAGLLVLTVVGRPVTELPEPMPQADPALLGAGPSAGLLVCPPSASLGSRGQSPPAAAPTVPAIVPAASVARKPAAPLP